MPGRPGRKSDEKSHAVKGPKELIGARPKLLIGEGADEVNFFSAILRILGIAEVIVEECGGKKNLSNYLALLPVRSGFDRLIALGVTRDVDGKDAIGDPGDALRSVQEALRAGGMPIPSDVEVIQDGSPRVGIFLMPGGGRTGALEDLCLEAASGDPLMTCVDAYFACLADRGHPHPRAIRLAKARARVWLACRKEPDLSLGIAARKTAEDVTDPKPAGEEYWPLGSPAFDSLKQFLLGLFLDPPP